MGNYSLNKNRPQPYMVIDNFDECGREGVYAGSWDDCQAFLAEQDDANICGMYDIVPNPHWNRADTLNINLDALNNDGVFRGTLV
jgi:hypothetical protein